jgi:hypothetical protein
VLALLTTHVHEERPPLGWYTCLAQCLDALVKGIRHVVEVYVFFAEQSLIKSLGEFRTVGVVHEPAFRKMTFVSNQAAHSIKRGHTTWSR